MSSIRRIEANRRNAELSTGPRTAAGKAASSRNAVKHGLLSRQSVLPGEDADQYEQLRASVLDALAPAGAVEDVLADTAVSLVWRLGRLGRVEAGLLVLGMESPLGRAVRNDTTEVAQLGFAFAGQAGTFSVLSRYEASLTRQLQRILDDLTRSKGDRQEAAEDDLAVLRAV